MPGKVHVRLRQDEPDPARFGPADQRLPALLLDRGVEPARQLAHAGEPEVMARVAKLRLGVAEPDDEVPVLYFIHADTAGPAATAADRGLKMSAAEDRA